MRTPLIRSALLRRRDDCYVDGRYNMSRKQKLCNTHDLFSSSYHVCRILVCAQTRKKVRISKEHYDIMIAGIRIWITDQYHSRDCIGVLVIWTRTAE